MGKADAMNDWQEPENGPGRPEPQPENDPVLVFLTFVVFIALLTLLLMVFL